MQGLTTKKKKDIRKKLMKKQKNCKYCGCVLTKANRSIDHVIPKSVLARGANSINNLVLCCIECNNKKGNKLC